MWPDACARYERPVGVRLTFICTRARDARDQRFFQRSSVVLGGPKRARRASSVALKTSVRYPSIPSLSRRNHSMASLKTDCSQSHGAPNDPAAPIFHLAINLSGRWEIHEHTGSRGGLFRTRQAAIKYARDENPSGDFVIIDELDEIK